MKPNNKITIDMKNSLLFILALIFVSGCVGQTAKIDTNNGVILEKFNADPADVFDFQAVTFSVDVTNVGGTTANDVKIKLLGVEGAWRPATGAGTVSEIKKDIGTLKPPRIKDNIYGDSRFSDFTLTAPNLNEGDKTTFPVKARVEFSYATTGSIIVKAISLNQQQILQRKGEAVSEPLKESNSEGPVKFRFTRGSSPLVIDPDEGTPIEREFRFEIANVGQGWPISDDVVGRIGSTIKGSKIELRAPSGIRLVRCEGFTSGSESSFSATLRNDGKAPVSCTISIDTSAWRTKTEESLIFNIELNYKYFVESEVFVSVQGTKRDDIPVRPAPGVPISAPGVPIEGAPFLITAIPVGDVPVPFDIRITFDKALDANSAANAVTLLGSAENGFIGGTASLNPADPRMLIFTPSVRLRIGSSYTVTVGTNLRSASGVPLSNTATFNFRTTGADQIPPKLTLLAPLPVAPLLETFSRSQTTTISIKTDEAAACRIASVNGVTQNIAVPPLDSTKMQHSIPFTSSGEGKQTLEIKCADSAGNEDTTPLRVIFTVDFTAPAVSYTDPIEGATGVPRDKRITITFNDFMDRTPTRDATTPSGGAGTIFTITFSDNDRQMFLFPDTPMALGAPHTIEIKATAKDKAGNSMLQPFILKFTTG